MATRARPAQGELTRKIMLPYEPGVNPPLVDVGCNLTDRSFAKDLDDVVARSIEAGVETLIITGTSVSSSRAALNLAERIGMYSTAGVHPHCAKQCDEETLHALRELAAHPRAVAIGEAGLDFNRNFSPPEVQEEWFDKQVALACELRMPLFLHCRDAGERFTEILKSHQLTAPALVHCYTGGEEELRGYIDMGLYVGITGWVCDEREGRGEGLASILPLIPPDRLVIETDAPYLTPRTLPGPSKGRPRRCEPALLPYVLRAVAAALGEPEAEVAARTTANAWRLFGLGR